MTRVVLQNLLRMRNVSTKQNVQMVETNTETKLDELSKNLTETDSAEFSSSNQTIDVNVDMEAINETMELIAEDSAILSEYDNQYNALVASQLDLETQCQNFQYPEIESITTSSKAAEVLRDVEAQIQRIEQLIKTAEDAIKVLEKEKEVAQAQLEKREQEKETLEEEMEAIKKQIEDNEARAKSETEQYEKDAEVLIQNYIKEYESSNLEASGVKLEDYLAGKMASFLLPSSVSALYAANDTLVTQLNTKGEQVKLVASAIDVLKTKIADIDNQLEIQNGKLEDYNKNLDAAKKYHSGVTELKSALQEKEKAQRKKKKWYKKLARKLVKVCEKIVKKVVDVVKDVIKGVTGAVSGTLKFAGKHLGDITKSIGLGDELFEGMGNTLAAATDFVGATCTFDKDEMRESLKDLEDGAKLTVENKIFKKAVEFYKDTTEYVGDKVGDVVSGVCDSVGTVIDKAGLDSFGNGIKSVGEFAEGIIDMGTGVATANDDLLKEGWEKTEDNAFDAVKTIGTVVATVMTAGAGAGLGVVGSAVAQATESTVAGLVTEVLTEETIKELQGRAIDGLDIAA